MKDFLTIFKKELRRFFTDTRMLLALFLPGILIFAIYTLMGNVISNSIASTSSVTNTTYRLVITDNYGTEDMPRIVSYMEAVLQASDSEKTNSLEVTSIAKEDAASYEGKVKDKEYTLLMEFSDDFETDIYDVSKAASTAVTFVYQSEDKASSHFYALCAAYFEKAYSPTYYSMKATNLGENDYASKTVMGILVPMLTVSLLYSTIMSICPESFAGEKERGTLSALLLTPMRRSELVAGKILALSIAGVASGLVSFLGMALSLPKMLEGLAITLDAMTILLLFLLVVSLLLLFVAFGTFISSLSKGVKEATGYLSPLTVVFMLLAMVPSLTGITGLGYAFIPVLNMGMATTSIMNGTPDYLFLAITVLTNLLFTGLFVFLSTRVFKKERFLFH